MSKISIGYGDTPKDNWDKAFGQPKLRREDVKSGHTKIIDMGEFGEKYVAHGDHRIFINGEGIDKVSERYNTFNPGDTFEVIKIGDNDRGEETKTLIFRGKLFQRPVNNILGFEYLIKADVW